MSRRPIHFLAICCIFAVLYTGCFKQQPITAPCPPPPYIERPTLKAPALKAEATMVDVLTAYVLDAIAMDGYSRKLEALLAAYRPVEKAEVRK